MIYEPLLLGQDSRLLPMTGPDWFFHACQDWCTHTCADWHSEPVKFPPVSEAVSYVDEPDERLSTTETDLFCHPCQDWCLDPCTGWDTRGTGHSRLNRAAEDDRLFHACQDWCADGCEGWPNPCRTAPQIDNPANRDFLAI